MKVKVQPFITVFGVMQYGIYVKRWWLPVWVRCDYWGSEATAVSKAQLIKNPKAIDIY